MDKRMGQDNLDDSANVDTKLKECPRCRTPIRRSTRYGQIINKQLTLINEVRKKISGNPDEVTLSKNALKTALLEDFQISKHFPTNLLNLRREVNKARSLPALSVAERQRDCLLEFSEIMEKLNELPSVTTIKTKEAELKNKIWYIVSWLFRNRSYFSEQEKEDLQQERIRCKDALKLIQFQQKFVTSGIKHFDVERYIRLVEKKAFTDLSPYVISKQEKVDLTFKKMKRHLPELVSGLGISDEERKMIVSAVNLTPGHWYQCKNGHVYVVGECGGAMEESKCPECNETIENDDMNQETALTERQQKAARFAYQNVIAATFEDVTAAPEADDLEDGFQCDSRQRKKRKDRLKPGLRSSLNTKLLRLQLRSSPLENNCSSSSSGRL